MGVPGTLTTDRRDAAVTAALAGMVLVIVGYASGIGLRPPAEVSATLPDQTTPSASPDPVLNPAPPSLSAVEAPAAVAMPTSMPPAHVPSVPATPASHTPTVSPSAMPTQTPTPSDCPQGLVDTLVGDLPLVSGLTSLVSGLLTTPLLGSTAVPDSGPTDPLGCTVKSIIGTSCCADTAAARTTTGVAP
jgi:hypothetical protein